jgi:hypothetical protein
MSITQLPWHQDEHVRMLGLKIHDGRMIDLSVIHMNKLSFSVRGVDNTITMVEIVGVGDFSISIVNWPIVSELWVWNVCAVPEQYMDNEDYGWNLLYSSLSDTKTRAAKVMRERPASSLFLLGTVYGGTLAAVCDRINVFEELKNE